MMVNLPVSHALEGIIYFIKGQCSFLVSVKALKHPLPLIYVSEQLSKLLDVNSSCHVGVKHVDHHSARLLAELGHVPISKSLPELSSINVSTVILVNCLLKGENQ